MAGVIGSVRQGTRACVDRSESATVTSDRSFIVASCINPLVTCCSSMTPLESELLLEHGMQYLYEVEVLTIGIFCYGASESSSLAVYDSSTISIKGAFVVLFSASVVIFMFVFAFEWIIS